jgi:hypothetical protein
VLAACASAGDPAGRDAPRPPAGWSSRERVEAPVRPAPPPAGRAPGGYPDSAAGAPPLYLAPVGRWAVLGRQAAERRRLAGWGRSFLVGRGAVVPVRRAVWAEDAFEEPAGADTVVFRTPWIPASRLDGELRCETGPGVRVRARLAALFRVAGDDLLVEGWMETDGAARCEGQAQARDRLRAFADDLDRFAREAARRGVPVPLPRR